ncbi:glycosyltransferase family 2 protein [Adhaeribacter radiodurans]|uniref:Glycosyltransferase family 2 protein n=1 Tax=Adhaeribacter radiodurans TaxID=2745197 RepID=A0A7L7L836_9BACT|nr:glycosyltransferase family 2 protein [Adhaeribacter radiodurans]QMU28958.1 glycosyltransferase family 2 protein [Adhaeribacter radiodurans]
MEEPVLLPNYKRLAQKLELVLFTYNRAPYLNHALTQLQGSPFSFCKITILDNCSTDETPAVIQQHIACFPNMVYERNKINIGGNANILRAAERSNGLYTWLICDDDEFDFSNCDDVIDVVLEEKVDLIHVGGHGTKPWQLAGITATPKELMAKGYHFVNNASFVPASLFRTQVFYDSLDEAYQNIRNWYPHLVYTFKFYTDNKLVYLAKNRIVTASVGRAGYNYDDWLDRWVNTSFLMKQSSDRRKVFFDVYNGEKKLITLARLTLHAFKKKISFFSLFKVFYLYSVPGLLASIFYLAGIGLLYPFIKNIGKKD